MFNVLEFTSVCIPYVLGKKDVSCFKEFTLATDNGVGKGEVGAVL